MDTKEKGILTDVRECPVCGESHEQIAATKLISSVLIGNDKEPYPFVLQCPKTHRPVYLKHV